MSSVPNDALAEAGILSFHGLFGNTYLDYGQFPSMPNIVLRQEDEFFIVNDMVVFFFWIAYYI